jgi:hypothetical protein
MKTIFVEGRKGREVWDSKREEFIAIPDIRPTTLVLEHSLLAVSKWESKFHKAFLGKSEKDRKTPEEMLEYIKCMTINNVDPNIYYCLTNEQIKEIGDYISDSMTATTIRQPPGKTGPRTSETVTSELIYYWMVVHQIPFECQKWHLNRLLTLIQVCNIKNAPAKKMSKRDIYAQNRSLNAARRAKHHSHG